MTPKQERFVQEYLIDLNATQAAIRAGYSPRSAQQISDELLSKPVIRAHVDELMAERSKRTGVNADRIIRELARIAFLQANQVINMEDATLIDGAAEDDIAAIASVKVKTFPTADGIGYEREIKVADKLKALELLGKHNGMFVEKRELAATLNIKTLAELMMGDDDDCGVKETQAARTP